MRRDTLIDFFDDRLRSSADFLIQDEGYRTRTYSYDRVRTAAVAFGERLMTEGSDDSGKVVLWGENQAAWVAAFWGCLLARRVVVPVDARATPDLLERILDRVDAKLIVIGDDVQPPRLQRGVKVWRLNDVLSASARNSASLPSTASQVTGNDLVEIVFTSGTTAEPKGVTITHGNVLANLVPVEREVLRYRRYARPFAPLRFLNLLPLSHMFGQAMATFVPPMLMGATVFMRGYNPAEIVRQLRTRRVSVLVCVPKILGLLRDHVMRVSPETAQEPTDDPHFVRRWWRYRRVHRMLGFKFWAIVVGGAPLDPSLEAFWQRLGFLVVQGYGLTETAPVVTLNHPFRAKRGSVGAPIAGVDVRIADDGEILVRGPNVTSGYYDAPDQTDEAFEDGWFHTGDIGELDDAGQLSIRGRKKDVIVTPEGLNVFPEDIEQVVREIRGIRDAAVVGVQDGEEERTHAVVVTDDGSDIDTETVIREANARLEEHQKIRQCSRWPNSTLPRTEGTQKLRRRELRSWIETGSRTEQARPRAADAGVVEIVRRYVPDRTINDSTTLDALGLSSLERIELQTDLEQQFDRTIDELAFANLQTVGDLRNLVEDAPLPTGQSSDDGAPLATSPPRPSGSPTLDFPTWSRGRLAGIARRIALPGFLLPLTRMFAWIHVEGRQHVAELTEPVVFAANHQSLIDGPVILAALPVSRRYRVAPAAAKEFFAAHFHPARHSRRARAASSLSYYLGSLFFNIFPLPQQEAGAREAIRYLGTLLSEGTSALVFPEGQRTETGAITRFKPGIGMIAARLKVPIVPVRIEGLDRVLHHSWRMARPGRVRVAFGEPMRLEGKDYKALAAQVEEAVRAL